MTCCVAIHIHTYICSVLLSRFLFNSHNLHWITCVLILETALQNVLSPAYNLHSYSAFTQCRCLFSNRKTSNFPLIFPFFSLFFTATSTICTTKPRWIRHFPAPIWPCSRERFLRLIFNYFIKKNSLRTREKWVKTIHCQHKKQSIEYRQAI